MFTFLRSEEKLSDFFYDQSDLL